VTVTPRAIRGAAVLAAAALLVGGACGARPVSPADCQASKPVQQGSLLELQADPAESSIRGVLPGADPAKAGQPYAVRWLVDARKASGDLRIQAAREGSSQVYRETFAAAPATGQVTQFPTELVFPAAGCWDADVFTGTAAGSLTFRVA
jgi:hypothetical protein